MVREREGHLINLNTLLIYQILYLFRRDASDSSFFAESFKPQAHVVYAVHSE